MDARARAKRYEKLDFLGEGQVSDGAGAARGPGAAAARWAWPVSLPARSGRGARVMPTPGLRRVRRPLSSAVCQTLLTAASLFVLVRHRL